MTVHYEGDSRPYLRTKPLHASRHFVQCIAEERSDEGVRRCTFCQREDSFKQALKKRILHKCEFAPVKPGVRQALLNEVLKPDRQLPPILLTVARFLAKANISMEAATNGELRELLLQAYDLGWEDREAADKSVKHLSLDDARRRAIPNLTVSNLCQALEENHTRTRRELLEIFRCYMFVGLSIDGVTIHSRKFLNFDVTNPISSIVPFTYDFLDQSTMTTNEFVVALADMLHRMEADGLRVAGITSDGCRFQIAGLSSFCGGERAVVSLVSFLAEDWNWMEAQLAPILFA